MKKISIVLASWPIREPLDKCWKTPSPYECMPDISFLAEGVNKQLLKIKINKSSGPDLIPARILRYAASKLAVVLPSLFQQSYDSGTLPLPFVFFVSFSFLLLVSQRNPAMRENHLLRTTGKYYIYT